MMAMRLVTAAALLGLVVCSACVPPPHQAGRLHVMATTSTLASLGAGAGGKWAAVKSLVPIGISPEDYQPTPGDIGSLHDAQVLIENGVNLETWLDQTVANSGNANLKIVTASAGLPVINMNPHLWMDPEYARSYVARMRDAFIAADPGHADDYRASAAAYDAKLVALTARTRAKINTIPPSHRTLIVFHDAFDYYARRFGLRIVGAIEPIAGAEPNPAHIAELIRQARAQHVRAVFAEHEYSDTLAKSLASSAGNLKVAFLYDDSLGIALGVQDYIGMIDTDTDTIVDALK